MHVLWQLSLKRCQGPSPTIKSLMCPQPAKWSQHSRGPSLERVACGDAGVSGVTVGSTRCSKHGVEEPSVKCNDERSRHAHRLLLWVFHLDMCIKTCVSVRVAWFKKALWLSTCGCVPLHDESSVWLLHCAQHGGRQPPQTFT